MILIDTNALVALADPRDGLNSEATRDLRRLSGEPLRLLVAVLVEAWHLLPQPPQRERLRALIQRLNLRPYTVEDEGTLWAEVFAWLEQYGEHEPDWTDGCLAVLCGRDKRLRVWTYDAEFATVWRQPDGTKIPLAVKGRR